MALVVDRFIEQANRSPHALAVKTAAHMVTYGQLLEIVHKTAAYIDGMDIQKHEPIGLILPNSIDFITLILACELTGHPAVLLGVAQKSSELHYHIKNLGLRVIFAFCEFDGEIEKTGAKKILSGIEPPWENISLWQLKNIPVKLMEGDFICQITSGTNGIPKSVIRTGDAVLREISDITKALALTERDTVLTIPPIHHSFGLIGGVLTPLCTGAALVLENGFIPADAMDIIERRQVSILFAVPFMYHLFTKSARGRTADFSSLRFCLSAGAPLRTETAGEFTKRFGKYISQDYGSTEAGTICLNLNTERYIDAVGRPLSGCKVKIVKEHVTGSGVGEVGEIWIKSAATARCYLYPQELNAINFNGDWFNTGDLGYEDQDGYIYVTGRKSSLINVAGLKVDPSEIEIVISRIPGVEEAAVVGIDREASGQIIKAVVSVSAAMDERDILRFCKEHLSDYKIPRVIEIVNTLPKSATGKVLRKNLIL